MEPSDPNLADLLREATWLLESLIDDRGGLAELSTDERVRFLTAAGRVSRPDKTERRKLDRTMRKKVKVEKRVADTALLNQTAIRKMRSNPIFQTPRRQVRNRPVKDTIGTVNDPRTCYVCHDKYSEVHWFYDSMCTPCGDYNYLKRAQTADLTGRVALITGSRLKIGYQAAILMLRSGCEVHCTTRFPKDAARRYGAEADFEQWGSRLHIHGIDLRHTPSVEALCTELLHDLDRLDFIINNACQTVRRPPGFYSHLMEAELDTAQLTERETALVTAHPTRALTQGLGDKSSALSQLNLVAGDDEAGNHLFPAGELDKDRQQIDLREVNSWRLQMHEVPTIELLEVHLVNAVAPFLLNARLKPLMLAVPTADKHIVNVSAVEGQFYRTFKSDRHPHTNMAKASLNMMTRTSAADYINDGIHMNSVDTGWVTDEDPVAHAERKKTEHRFHPPLDIVDGAARIVDPILHGINTGEHVWGQFIKDYKPADW